MWVNNYFAYIYIYIYIYGYEMRPSKSIGGKPGYSLNSVETQSLSEQHLEKKTNLRLQFSSKSDLPLNAILCEICVLNRISVTLEPKSKNVTHFWKVKHTLILPIAQDLRAYLNACWSLFLFLFEWLCPLLLRCVILKKWDFTHIK